MQSLLAICAMMIASLFTMGVHRSIIGSQMNMVRVEVENQASSVGLDILDYIGTRPFDEVLIAGGTVTDLSNFTPLPFEGGKAFDEAESIDAFHNMQTYNITTFKDGNTLDFNVEAEVRYVNIDPTTNLQIPSNTQTFSKAVTLEIFHERLRAPVRLTRVYTYP